MPETPKTVMEKSKDELVEGATAFRSILAKAEERYAERDEYEYRDELGLLDWIIDEFRHTVGETDFRKW
jgi:hypothetical protein